MIGLFNNKEDVPQIAKPVMKSNEGLTRNIKNLSDAQIAEIFEFYQTTLAGALEQAKNPLNSGKMEEMKFYIKQIEVGCDLIKSELKSRGY